MKIKYLSPAILKNTVGKWASFCSHSEDFVWTKSDANAMLMIKMYVEDCRKFEYKKYRERQIYEKYNGVERQGKASKKDGISRPAK